MALRLRGTRPQSNARGEERLRERHVLRVFQADHGGLRYLEQLELGLVRELLSERADRHCQSKLA